MLQFTPRLRVMRHTEIAGFLELPAHTGAVLPHVGEIVVLSDTSFDPDSLLAISAADAPKVISVWHFVGEDPEPEYAVEIEVRTRASDDALRSSFVGTGRGRWIASSR
ncbi:hypothetical protein N8D74_17660 (plasmid) [Curtobacterium flaccumfaciens]|uniref:Uncharacterized protein n=2 Tax=Curtobacterium poinsettiae TaxID=159612 RepID=A0A9Q9PC22_9MICO|nr:hypothetical protein [Curtobacterium flaccumfaciens]UXN27207.1 hypothetical protein N8D74_17660 [Curtobacterium flaccumfaciens]UXN30464.1 hypothetical protein N8D75_17690 [Curtobacterium flaccumfaciens]UYC82758.1 hypothetical protein OE229_17640 [Curtobacterium flaccumfaciens pv. poinsettiae]WQM79110.1 hypothetical protein PCFP21_290 [Curtobacterium flaccumfaciens pv. poinsettiae]WQM79192.1 hypothetical protein PCFP23_215 [Curtobacterium flaccumfaciens pv. poinsettiae]